MHIAKWIFPLLLTLPCLLVAQPKPEANLMPLPASMKFGDGRLPIDQSFSISITGYDEPRLRRAVDRVTKTLVRQTGIPFGAVSPAGSKPVLVVNAAKASAAIQEVGEDESYTLTVKPDGAKLDAPNPLGILRGLQTFVQLVELTPEGFGVREVTIEDRPRFAWRGLMIDVARHFQPVDVLERNLDAMETVKLNVLHWHLSDNQGFRVESKKLPKLHQLGSEGQYYTQEQIKHVIEYARDRGIRVMPEFDIPGHTTAWLVAYPELASLPGPYQIEHLFGIFDPAMDPSNEEVYRHLDRFIGEMALLFPDAYFHIGGDEVNGKQWDASPKIQEFTKTHNLADNHALQAHFNKRVQAIVSKHRKTMMGWDEILQPELPKDIVIHAWRNPEAMPKAVKAGFRGVLSYGYYLDLSQSTSFHYSIDPAGGNTPISAEEEKMILGGEACMWTEMAPPTVLDSRIWPRMAAVAERFWSPRSTTDVLSMYRRMEAQSLRLQWLPSRLYHRDHYLPGLQRLAASADTEALQVLADVVEPVKEYKREGQHKKAHGRSYATYDPFNRLVDIVRADSMVKVRFGELVDLLLSGKASPSEQTELRGILQRWAENDVRLQPVLSRTSLLKEVAPISTSLSVVGNAGLQAFEYLRSGSRPTPEWVQQQLNMVGEAEKPKAELLLPVVPSVKQLLQAVAPPQPGS